MPDRLFPADLPARRWSRFEARGFAQPASGVVFSADAPPCCGLPLGGVATGCIDLDARGAFGFSSLFNLIYPEKSFAGRRGNVFTGPLTRKTPAYRPCLGLAVDGAAWVLAARDLLDAGELETCVDPVFVDRRDRARLAPVAGVRGARRIDYWGHYPIADLEYELEAGPAGAAPVSVGLRAWAPFLPGDLDASGTPCAFFDVHARNTTARRVQATLAFSFPGPEPAGLSGDLPYAGDDSFHNPPRWPAFPPPPARVERAAFQAGALRGVSVDAGGRAYALGALGQPGVRWGGELGRDGAAWTAIQRALPDASPSEPGASLAVDFALEPGAEARIRFVLAWHAPEWQGAAGHTYTAMYARRFSGAVDVAAYAQARGDAWQERVIAWQREIYADPAIPPWLQDCLINNLALIPETTYWAQARPPLGAWCHQGGFFGMLESPRGCPQIECNPCTFYGNLPIVYFFPELARSQLEGYRHYQREDGAAPFVIGRWGPPDMATPGWEWQVSLNGPVYAVLADRLWQRTGDRDVLLHYYPSVKKNAQFTACLNPAPDGAISMPSDNRGMEWFEWGEWLGMCAHLGGVKLAGLRVAERMAEAAGDTEFAAQCRAWFADGSAAMENKLWAGGYYLNYYEESTGRRSDAVMGYQLDGEWIAAFHGLPGVFRADRVPVVLDTLRRCNMPAVQVGALSFATPAGQPLGPDEKIVEYGSAFIFLPEIMMLAMNYLYAGQRDFGLAFLERAMHEVVCAQGHPWDLPNMVAGDTGRRIFGTDYYQNLMLWALPAAIERSDLRAACRPEGLIDRILAAARGHDPAARPSPARSA
jgi:uncharacterized protein (DUF608 family)